MTLVSILCVGLGGALGALVRGLGGSTLQMRAGTAFPWGTFAINMVACLIGGFFVHASLGDVARLAIATGFLGGLSTLSTLNFESMKLMEHGRVALGAGYLVLTYVCGIALVLAGFALYGLVLGPS